MRMPEAERLYRLSPTRTKTLATPDDAGSFSAFGIDMWWKLELLDEVDKLSPPIFFNHQHFSDCGRGLRVSGLLALFLG